jgi:molecular chaperone DnaK (HSP70)
VFTTVKDNQTSVKILVFQGESERAEENELLGEFILTGPAPRAQGRGRDRGHLRDLGRRHRVGERARTWRPACSRPSP